MTRYEACTNVLLSLFYCEWVFILSKHSASDALNPSRLVLRISSREAYCCGPASFALWSMSFSGIVVCSVPLVCNPIACEIPRPSKPQVLTTPIHKSILRASRHVLFCLIYDYPMKVRPFIFELSCTSPGFDKYLEAQLYRQIEHQFSAFCRGTISTSPRLDNMDNILTILVNFSNKIGLIFRADWS